MSNAQSWADIFAPIEAHNRQVVLQNTWGHLAPQKNTTYRGEILFCKSDYNSGTITLISSKMDIDSSPWFYDSVHEFLYSFDKLECGQVYKINATWRNYKWWGKPEKVYSL
ncbi:MAG: hypothetical protein AABY22_07595 [Nanoarchaeota archaeon]